MSSQQKKIFILSGIAVIAFLAWFFFLLHPLQNALHEKDDLIVQEQIRSEIARKQEENVQATVPFGLKLPKLLLMLTTQDVPSKVKLL